MDERLLRELIEKAKTGSVSRRVLVRRLVGLGLTAPFASQLLSQAGLAQGRPPSDYTPVKAGGGGPLRTLFWQAPTSLNPHFAVGVKDQEGSRIFYEPLAAWDPDGNLVPILADELPEVENGGLSPDGMSVIWKLKQNVRWHDGRPFSADDVVFTWEFAADPETAATTIGSYRDITLEKLDRFTVRVRFKTPTPFWADAFVGQAGQILPKHLFEAYKGGASRNAPTNFRPVGTGPYRFVEFIPGDLVTGERNPDYYLANCPHFDSIEVKGGGDAVSAARAVIQTGEYDYAWNLQVEDEILLKLERSPNAKGRVAIVPGGMVEQIQFNFSDPWLEVDGERSNPKTIHPMLNNPEVRKAITLLIDRESIEKYIYGRAGIATGNYINNPKQFVSLNSHWSFNIEEADKLLDEAGWSRGPDGIRVKDGRRLKLVFQTSTNTLRQKTQAIVKQACEKTGIEIELKSVTPSVYFSSDVSNPDTYTKFYADIQMFGAMMTSPDPAVLMRSFLSWEIASKANKWQGRNITRWSNSQYDAAFRRAECDLDPVSRAALFIKMNDLVIGDPVVIPVVYRPSVSALSRRLRAKLSGWDNVFWDLRNWYGDA